MAFSKTFLLFGVAFAIILLISHDVSARELAETSQKTEGGALVDNSKKEGVHADGYYGGGGHWGGGGGGGHWGGGGGGGHWGGGGGGWGGGGGHWGGGGWGGCRGPHCKAADKVDAQQAAENGGDHN